MTPEEWSHHDYVAFTTQGERHVVETVEYAIERNNPAILSVADLQVLVDLIKRACEQR